MQHIPESHCFLKESLYLRKTTKDPLEGVPQEHIRILTHSWKEVANPIVFTSFFGAGVELLHCSSGEVKKDAESWCDKQERGLANAKSPWECYHGDRPMRSWEVSWLHKHLQHTYTHLHFTLAQHPHLENTHCWVLFKENSVLRWDF